MLTDGSKLFLVEELGVIYLFFLKNIAIYYISSFVFMLIMPQNIFLFVYYCISSCILQCDNHGQ